MDYYSKYLKYKTKYLNLKNDQHMFGGAKKSNLPIVICGPSGAGKSTLIERLKKDYPDRYGFVVSHTTRDPRPGEVNGVAYWFVKKEEMEKKISNDEFLEYSRHLGNIYGTSFKAIDDVQKSGKICILDIDIGGVKACMAREKTDKKFKIGAYVFISPPSIEVLRERLIKRGTSPEDLERRLAKAKIELEEAKEMKWKAYLIADDFEKMYKQFKSKLKIKN